MASVSKIRSFARLVDATTAPFWAIGSDGKIVYISQGACEWLGVEADSLIGRLCVAGAAIDNDPLDHLAASISPPAGIHDWGTAFLRIQPPSIAGDKIEPREARFIRLGDEMPVIIAAAGDFKDRGDSKNRARDRDIHEAVALRQRLDRWRKTCGQRVLVATSGESVLARRMRARMKVATSTRCHLGIFGPVGSGAREIGNYVHDLSTKSEPLVHVQGALMDSELLDATLVPLVNVLADSNSQQGTALVTELDEMPADAQCRLVELMASFGDRLRLIGTCQPYPGELVDPREQDHSQPTLDELPETNGLHPLLRDVLYTLTLSVAPLASRVEDIPMIATALVATRHARGEGPAERIGRAAMDALVIYPWPGNFDELDDAIRYAIHNAPHQSIGTEHLPLAIRSFRASQEEDASALQISLDDALQRYEMRLIKTALDSSDGNRAEAARRLGISRSRLLRRLNESD